MTRDPKGTRGPRSNEVVVEESTQIGFIESGDKSSHPMSLAPAGAHDDHLTRHSVEGKQDPLAVGSEGCALTTIRHAQRSSPPDNPRVPDGYEAGPIGPFARGFAGGRSWICPRPQRSHSSRSAGEGSR